MLLKNLLKDSFKKSLVLMMTHEWIFKQTYYSETSLLRTRLLQKPHSWETKSKSFYNYFFVNFSSLLRKTHSWEKNNQSLQIRKNEVRLYLFWETLVQKKFQTFLFDYRAHLTMSDGLFSIYEWCCSFS